MKYQKSSSYMVIENVVRFNDFVNYTLNHFEYENLILPKNLLLLLGMNEVNGFIKCGSFSHFTREDSFLQKHTAIMLGDVNGVYISIGNGTYHSEKVVDLIQRGIVVPSYDEFGAGYTCNVSIMDTIKFEDPAPQEKKTTVIVYTSELCSIPRLTNYADRNSYYSDDDLIRLYRVLSRNFKGAISQTVVNELQKELSAMCEFIREK